MDRAALLPSRPARCRLGDRRGPRERHPGCRPAGAAPRGVVPAHDRRAAAPGTGPLRGSFVAPQHTADPGDAGHERGRTVRRTLPARPRRGARRAGPGHRLPRRRRLAERGRRRAHRPAPAALRRAHRGEHRGGHAAPLGGAARPVGALPRRDAGAADARRLRAGRAAGRRHRRGEPAPPAGDDAHAAAGLHVGRSAGAARDDLGRDRRGRRRAAAHDGVGRPAPRAHRDPPRARGVLADPAGGHGVPRRRRRRHRSRGDPRRAGRDRDITFP